MKMTRKSLEQILISKSTDRMKHIVKKISNEPASLRNYRRTTPTPNYDDVNKEDIRIALLKEQGGLCAYCMKPISAEFKDGKPKTEIEHFKPQESYPKLSLDYMNMLGVCNGASHTHPQNERFLHCDKTVGPEGKVNGKVELRRLNPLKLKDSELLLSYTNDGKIYAKAGLEDVEYDLEKVLNLNNPVLIKQRKAVLDVAKDNLILEAPSQRWTVQLIDKHINLWRSRTARNHNFRGFCMVAVDFLERLKQRPVYQTRS